MVPTYQVSVIVSLHFVIKHLGLAGGGTGDQVLVEDAEDVAADVVQLLLDLKHNVLLAYHSRRRRDTEPPR